MRSFRIFITLACLGLALMVTQAFMIIKDNKAAKRATSDKGFAVIELFTSEGCSSCPPADALVARVQKEDNDKPVYILAFHVDYWDRLGWKDAYSSAAYSDRQRRYATWFKLESIYTPQIVVNGDRQFVGSESGSLNGAIKEGLEHAGSVEIRVSQMNLEGGKLNWLCRTTGVGNG